MWATCKKIGETTAMASLGKQSFRAAAISILLCGVVLGQQSAPPPSQCPVLATVASSKVMVNEEENIVIWFWNQGSKTTHGIEFQLMLLDAAGNRYPASQGYIAKGNTKPNTGDVVLYPAKSEQEHLGTAWINIEGIEVYVTRIMFADASTWKPRRGAACKTAFLNSNYAGEMEKLGKKLARQMEVWRKKWNREHPDNQIPEPTPELKKP
jgi:hypothetical protein